MTLYRHVLAIVAAATVGIVVPRMAEADEWNKQTVLTFSQDVEIPGTVLPAGRYIFQLADSLSNRQVVQVFDQKGRILATVPTIAAVRPTPASATRITFEAPAAGAPFPIKTWFYPGDLIGVQFIYRTHKEPTRY